MNFPSGTANQWLIQTVTWDPSIQASGKHSHSLFPDKLVCDKILAVLQLTLSWQPIRCNPLHVLVQTCPSPLLVPLKTNPGCCTSKPNRYVLSQRPVILAVFVWCYMWKNRKLWKKKRKRKRKTTICIISKKWEDLRNISSAYSQEISKHNWANQPQCGPDCLQI